MRSLCQRNADENTLFQNQNSKQTSYVINTSNFQNDRLSNCSSFLRFSSSLDVARHAHIHKMLRFFFEIIKFRRIHDDPWRTNTHVNATRFFSDKRRKQMDANSIPGRKKIHRIMSALEWPEYNQTPAMSFFGTRLPGWWRWGPAVGKWDCQDNPQFVIKNLAHLGRNVQNAIAQGRPVTFVRDKNFSLFCAHTFRNSQSHFLQHVYDFPYSETWDFIQEKVGTWEDEIVEKDGERTMEDKKCIWEVRVPLYSATHSSIPVQNSVEPDLKQFRKRWGSDVFRLFNVIGSMNSGSNGNFTSTTPPEVWESIQMMKDQFEFLDGAVSIMFGDFLTANGYPTIVSQQHEGGALDVRTTWGYKTWLTGAS
jgi:hypothetical protein